MKGQVTLTAILFTAIGLFVLVGFLPALNASFGPDSSGFASLDSMGQSIVSLIIPIMFIGMIVSFWSYVNPTRPQGGG